MLSFTHVNRPPYSHYRCTYRLVVGCSLVIASVAPVAGQDRCDIYREVGVFDTRQTTSELDRFRSFYVWLKASSSTEYETAKDKAIDIGLELEDLVVDFGYEDSQEGWHKFKQAMETEESFLETLRQRSATLVVQANQTLAEGLNACVARGGVFMYAIHTSDPKRFAIRITYTARGGSPPDAKVRDFTVSASGGVTCSPTPKRPRRILFWTRHDKLRTGVDLMLNCERAKARSTVLATINTSSGAETVAQVPAAPPKYQLVWQVDTLSLGALGEFVAITTNRDSGDPELEANPTKKHRSPALRVSTFHWIA